MLAELGSAASVIAQMALGILLPHYIVNWDVRGLSQERWLRSWPPASHYSAVVVFGPIAVLVHFVRTRRNVAGLVLGLFGALVAMLPGMLLGLVVPSP